MNKQLAPENIVVYRYVDPKLLRSMMKWNDKKLLTKNTVIFDKGFLSTTLTQETVQSRDYTTIRNKVLKIYVPQGTPCIYLELIADMNENEMLFPPMTKLKVLSNPFFSRYIECIIEK